jgi:hypothetical protein
MNNNTNPKTGITNPTDSSTIQYIIPRLNDLYYNFYTRPVLSDTFSVVGSFNFGFGQGEIGYTYNGRDYFPGSLSSDLNSLAYIINIDFNGSQWIAVGGTPEGSGATMAVSSDGINWEAPLTNYLPYGVFDLAWGNKRWVAIGSDGGSGANFPNRIQYSYDGLTWAVLGDNPLSIDNWNEIAITSIAHNGSYFLISFFDGHDYGAGNVNRAYVATSTDGITWSNKTNITGVFPIDSGSSYSYFNSITSLAWSGRLWVGTNAGSTYPIGYSFDGVTWYRASDPVISIGSTVSYNGTRFLAASGNEADPYYLVTSSDGISWTGVTSPLYQITDITWNGTYWIVSNLYGDSALAYSTDLVNWHTSTSANNLFPVVGTTAVTSRNRKNYYLTNA